MRSLNNLATNRSWTTDTGEKKEDAEFHNIVAWNKLGELCSQLLKKGRKVYLEGRLSTKAWTAQDGQQRKSTEIVIDDMIILDSLGRRTEDESVSEPVESTVAKAPAKKARKQESDDENNTTSSDASVSPDDIPF